MNTYSEKLTHFCSCILAICTRPASAVITAAADLSLTASTALSSILAIPFIKHDAAPRTPDLQQPQCASVGYQALLPCPVVSWLGCETCGGCGSLCSLGVCVLILKCCDVLAGVDCRVVAGHNHSPPITSSGNVYRRG